MEARQVLVVGGVALAAFVVGRLSVASGERGDSVTRHAGASDAAVPDALSASLTRIESRLDALSLADVRPSEVRAPVERPEPANTADLNEWAALTNDLRSAIDALGERARSVAVTSFEAAPSNASWRAVLASAPPFDQRELQRLLDELGILSEENFVFPLESTFMTRAELVSRLGLPTRPLETSNPSSGYVYDCDLPHPSDSTQFVRSVTFKFDGVHIQAVYCDLDSVEKR